MKEEINQTITIAPNLEVNVKYVYEGPREAPKYGYEWADELDYPIVSVSLYIPATDNGGIVQFLQDYNLTVFGSQLSYSWGHPENLDDKRFRYNSSSHSAPTVLEAYQHCVLDVDEAIKQLRSIVDSRNARLQRRADTITKSKINSPFNHTD